MAATQVFSANNVAMVAAPPAYYVPDVNGTTLPPGATALSVTTVSSLYPANTPAQFAIEFEYGGQWQQEYQDGGYILGPHTFRGAQTSTNHFGVSLGTLQNGVVVYPSSVRLRVDSVPGGTLDSITITVG